MTRAARCLSALAFAGNSRLATRNVHNSENPMINTLLASVEATSLKKEAPTFNIGDTVDVATRIVEGDKERLQTFSGTVIMRKGRGTNETFTVRYRRVHGPGGLANTSRPAGNDAPGRTTTAP